ncbi:uncharacterized protein LOC108622645 [Ceratina calcarata]|uniref:Uncharacterized protein LOC108622645 n=1 Tax=Ceratina calcarata TaxID=156304 RepID=A0AAJ7N3P9_9HYME|nr:uncharacterized protein LOC108622645 [Ceratina calcarata]
MLEKTEENVDSDSNLVRIKLIADKRTILEKQFLQVQEEIKICFAQLAQTVRAREKQLLRQSEAIYRQQLSLALSSHEILSPSIVVLNDRDILDEQIKQFGRIELTGSNTTVITDLEPYKIEEYQDINKDHVSFDKSIKNSETLPNTKNEFPIITEDEQIDNIPIVLKSSSVTNLTGTSAYTTSSHETSFEKDEHCLKLKDTSKTGKFEKVEDCVSQVTDLNEQESTKNCRNSGKNIIEDQQNHGHTEQVQQWLDQILLETEIEPTIHEMEKLPEISEAYVCTKFQVET